MCWGAPPGWRCCGWYNPSLEGLTVRCMQLTRIQRRRTQVFIRGHDGPVRSNPKEVQSEKASQGKGDMHWPGKISRMGTSSTRERSHSILKWGELCKRG